MPRPVFVIPHYSDTEQSWQFLHRTMATVIAQTDDEWEAIIVDDCSPSSDRERLLDEVRQLGPGRVNVTLKASKTGPGSARNVGVTWAARRHAPFVLFLDADDLAHQDRLRMTRDYFAVHPDVQFVYSTFDVIDEDDEYVPLTRLTPSVREIIEGHRRDPVEGRHQWIRVAQEKGYTTLTSTVAVRTELAAAHRFPATYVSEDSHAWLRMLASGTVGFVKVPLARYRICDSMKGSSTRDRIGRDFYWMKMHVDFDGLVRAIDIARADGTLSRDGEAQIKRGFYLNQARTLIGERQTLAAAVCQGLAELLAFETEDTDRAKESDGACVSGGAAARV